MGGTSTYGVRQKYETLTLENLKPGITLSLTNLEDQNPLSIELKTEEDVQWVYDCLLTVHFNGQTKTYSIPKTLKIKL